MWAPLILCYKENFHTVLFDRICQFLVVNWPVHTAVDNSLISIRSLAVMAGSMSIDRPRCLHSTSGSSVKALVVEQNLTQSSQLSAQSCWTLQFWVLPHLTLRCGGLYVIVHKQINAPKFWRGVSIQLLSLAPWSVDWQCSARENEVQMSSFCR